jgi:hypothetical protein
MSKKPNSHHHIGHHMPEGRDGIEIRIWEDDRGYYASTIYNPRGRIPADIGPFDTSLQAIVAGFERHGLEYEGRGNVVPFRRAFIEDVPSIDMSAGIYGFGS